MLRIRYSRACWSTKPPPVLAPKRRTAASMLGGRDVEPAHHHRVGHDAVLAHLAADRDDLRDAGDGQELRADDEVGDLAQLHGRDRSAR